MDAVVPPYPITFYTEYRQFYIEDLNAEFNMGADGFWTDETTERGMAIGEGGIAIGTASHGHIRLFFEVTDKEPTLSLAPWDRVVEGSLTLSTGRIGIVSCTDSEVQTEQQIPPGGYRVRVHKAFLREIVANGDGDDYHDFYWIIVYPGERRGFEMLQDTFKPGKWIGAG